MEITLKVLKGRYSKKLNKLIGYGDLGLYNDDGIVAYEEAFNITKKDSDELLKMALDFDFYGLVDENEEEDDWDDETPEYSATFSSAHALVALSSLEISDVKEEIMDVFDNISPDNDAYLFAFDYYVASIYSQNMNFINDILLDNKNSIEKRIHIFYAFEEIVKYFQNNTSLESIKNVSIKLLKQKEKNSELNSLALNILLLTNNGVNEIKFIRECFRNLPIDELYIDSLEEIEVRLGLREKEVEQISISK